MRILNQFFLMLLISGVNFLNCEGQTVFKKNYDYANLSNFNCYETQDGGFITGMGVVSKLDSIGNILSFRALINSPGFYWKTLIKINENKYFVDGLVDDLTCSPSLTDILLVCKIDSTLQLNASSKYTLIGNCFNRPNNMSATRDGGLISVGDGFIHCGNFACKDKFYAMCLDSQMHPIWGSYYTNHFGGAQFGKQTPDGGFLLGFNLDTAGAVVAKTDSVGSIIWCKSYIRPKGFIHDCAVNPDGTCVIVGYTDSVNVQPLDPLPANFAAQLFMIKLDTSGNVLWGKSFDSNKHWAMWRSNIVNTSDNGYAILGTVLDTLAYKPLLIKTDASGDTMWTAIHGVPTTFYLTQSLLQTGDKGYLMAGNAQFDGIASWLYRTDSLGHIPCNMLRQDTYTYPIFPIDSDIILTSIDGATEVPVNLNDATYSSRSVWDDCDFTIIPLVIKTRPDLGVHPNPTTGKIIIDIENPLRSDCSFDIYDHTGRLIFQKIFNTEKKKIEVDLSPYGKGLYLVELTERDQVSVKKIVVQ